MSDHRPITFEEFAQVVARIRGKVVWRSRAGSGTGSIFTLQFGLPTTADSQWGELCLMVYCAWRIVEANLILCSWHEDSDAALAPALQQLENAEVTSVVPTPWGDLTINFTNGRSLQIWNDTPFEEDSTCWWIGAEGHGSYGVENRNKFRFEPW